MNRHVLHLLLPVLLTSCAVGEDAPAPDPLAPFFRQEVGPPCAINSDCVTGLCDRLLIPRDSRDEAQGACSSIPFVVFPWQRALLVERLLDVVGDDDALREQVLTFAGAMLDAPDAPISLRLLCLELADGLLPAALEPAWAARLGILTSGWTLPLEQLLAGIILAGREAEEAAVERLGAAALRGPEARRIRAARELASLCLPAAESRLVELAISPDSRFLRAAVVEGVAGCPAPLRTRVLDAAAGEAMPYERAFLRRLGASAPDSAGDNTPAE